MPDELEQRSVHVVLAVEIGLVGYLVARIAGQRHWFAAMFGLIALLLGMVVVAVEIALAH
jgi:F0F1-type ATP synthase assembly protein I